MTEPTEEEIKESFEKTEVADTPTPEELKATSEPTETPTETPVVKEPVEPGTALDGKADSTARYQVVGDEDSVDWEQSFTKLSDAHKSLRTKLDTRTRPETIDDYQVKLEDGADEEAVQRFLTQSLELDLSIDQVNGMRKFLATEQATQKEQAPGKDAESVTSGLQKSWGNDYAKNIQFAQAAASELKLDMTDPAVGNNKPLIELLARIAPKLSEDITITKVPGNGAAVSEEEFNKLTAPVTIKGVELTLNDAGHPYWFPENQKIANAYHAQ